MEVKLVVLNGKHAGASLPLSGPKFFIGRAEDCNLRPHSDLVSRHHCVILLEEGIVAVRDFGSKNGTYVNGERVRAEQTLTPGDVLKVGDLELEVHIDSPIGGKKRPKVHSVQEAAARTAESALTPRPSFDAEQFDLGGLVGDETRRTVAESETKVLGPSAPELGAPPPPAPGAPRTPAAKPDEPNQQDAPQEADEDKKAQAVETRAGWRVTRKPTSVSSREAAAEMLKKLFQRHM